MFLPLNRQWQGDNTQMEHDALVAQQFGATARAYLGKRDTRHGRRSGVASARDCDNPEAAVLDPGCGAGHASFAVAPHAASVTTYDLTAQMLAVVAREAEARGFGNIATVEGMAEVLSFPGAHFDCVISR
jgi:ubiquinone/menaquinone biosynthesis C-methylase UbiE